MGTKPSDQLIYENNHKIFELKLLCRVDGHFYKHIQNPDSLKLSCLITSIILDELAFFHAVKTIFVMGIQF